MARSANASGHIFLLQGDAFAAEINSNANRLYHLLKNFDISELTVEDEYRNYFSHHHLGRRLFFSIQSSADIIYNSVKRTGRQVHEINFLDYGAGLGTLFMLAGMMGFKKTVHNDYMKEWQIIAQTICEKLRIRINEYVTGDIDSVIEHAKANDLQYHIIASRNVLEHIYDLPHFYNSLFKHNPNAVIYSTTTANYHNPAMRLYHIYIHKKAERTIYGQQRINELKRRWPALQEEQINQLVSLTRGKAKQDFTNTVNNFMNNIPVAADATLRTNTCDCITGIWIEHLLTKKEHASFAAAGFKLDYTPGFWDTHYRYKVLNFVSWLFNKIIPLAGNKYGVLLSPFVNIIAHR